MVDEPKKSIYGGMVAAPAFRDINRRLISYLNYVPDSDTAKFSVVSVPAKKSCSCNPAREHAKAAPANKGCRETAAGSGQLALVVPDFTGQTIREALVRIGSYRNRVKISGHGRIIAQEPAPGSRLEPGIDFVFTLSGEI
jgi:cell division protein FtsI (penicillin-binding protein 3)